LDEALRPVRGATIPSKTVTQQGVIGIDGSRLTVGERTGTETYTHQLLTAMAGLVPDEPIRIYLNAARPPADLPPFGESVCIPFPRLWTHVRLSWEMQRHPPAVLFVPAHVVPLRHPPTVVTIHDLGYLHHPDAHPPATRRMLHWTTKWSAWAARRVIAISDATRRDLREYYRVPNARISVIPHGVDPRLRPADPSTVQELRSRLRLPDRYILFVGTVQPRKNLARLAAALSLVQRAGFPHWLVVAGKRGWLADVVEEQIHASGMSHRVVQLGYVAANDLPALYSGADAFCFPSLYEGFGLPVLEAMACGTPVVAADRAALPEVVGNAALLVDPYRPADIAASLGRVLSDESLRRELIERGHARASQFTWQRTAHETLALLRDIRDRRI
jgi:glycosyltransferase involved in cell wall biosynthesis